MSNLNYCCFQDIVYGHFEYPKAFKPIINSLPMQRLKRIKQLGLDDSVFPSVEASRFSHSIGVMHLMQKFFKKIYEKNESDLKINESGHDYDFWEKVAMLCGLLHDVGQPPFSHITEIIFEKDHEEWTQTIISDISSTISIWKKFDYSKKDELIKAIQTIFIATYSDRDKIKTLNNAEKCISYLLSGSFDLDRLDFLLRDRAYSKLAGGVDLEWLALKIGYNESKGVYFEEDACINLEEFLYNRITLYWKMHFHRRVKATVCLLHKILMRLKEVYIELIPKVEGTEEEKKEKEKEINSYFINIVDEGGLKLLLSEQNDNIEQYLSLDDSTIFNIIKLIYNNKEKVTCINDTILNELCSKFIEREPYKVLIETHQEKDIQAGGVFFDKEMLNKIKQKILAKNIIPMNQIDKSLKYFLFDDVCQVTKDIIDFDKKIVIKLSEYNLNYVEEKNGSNDKNYISLHAKTYYPFHIKDVMRRFYIYPFDDDFIMDLRNDLKKKKDQLT